MSTKMPLPQEKRVKKNLFFPSRNRVRLPDLLSQIRRTQVWARSASQENTIKDARCASTVMAYHGLTYSHAGLCDPAVTPGYVEMTRQLDGLTMRWASCLHGIRQAYPSICQVGCRP